MTPEEHKLKLKKKWTPFAYSVAMTLFFVGLVGYSVIQEQPIDSLVYVIAFAAAAATVVYAADYYKFKRTPPLSAEEFLTIGRLGGMESFQNTRKAVGVLKAREDFPSDFGDRLDRLLESLGKKDRNGVEQCALGIARSAPGEALPRKVGVNLLAYVYCLYTTDDAPVLKAREACLKAIRSMGGDAARTLADDLTALIPTLMYRVAAPAQWPGQVRTVWSARVELLGEIGGPEAVKPLLEALENPKVSEMDRKAAMLALEKIGGEEALAGLEAVRSAPAPAPAPQQRKA